MSRQTSTINQPDNAWAGRLKQQLTLLDLSVDVMSDELDIGRATLYRMLTGQLLPRPELWLQMLRYIVLHPRSSLSWYDVQDLDTTWATLTSHQQPGDAYLLLKQLFEKIPGTLLASMLQYLSTKPDDRVALPLLRDYQAHWVLNQATLRELESWLNEQERHIARDEISQLLPTVRQTIAENQHWLTQHQQRLADIDQFVSHPTQYNEELSAHTGQLLALTNDIAELGQWRIGVDQSIITLDEKIGEMTLPSLWRRLWLATGQRWLGVALEDRWQLPIDVAIGLLVFGIIGAFFNWLPVPFRDNPVAQAVLFAVLIIIVIWDRYREWVTQNINAAPPTSAAPPPSPATASDHRSTDTGDNPAE